MSNLNTKPNFMKRSQTITPDSMKELLECLGFSVKDLSSPKLGKISAHIESVLRDFFCIRNKIENIPRPSHRRKDCNQIKRDSSRLIQTLSKVHNASLYDIVNAGYTEHTIVSGQFVQEKFRILIALLGNAKTFATKAASDLAGRNSIQGKPTRLSREHLIHKLNFIFTKHHNYGQYSSKLLRIKKMTFIERVFHIIGIKPPKRWELTLSVKKTAN